MKKFLYLHFFLVFSLFAQTSNTIPADANKESEPVKETTTIQPEAKSTEPTKAVETKSAEAKPDFAITQFLANDVNFRGNSIYGEKLSRRNQESYKSFSEAWLISTNVTFQLPLPGLKFLFTANTPIENRGNKDSDMRLQTSPGGDDQTSRFNQTMQNGKVSTDTLGNFTLDPSGKTSVDPSAVRIRREQNGLRDVFIGQMYYDWDTKIGGFRTGLFFLNNQNYPSKFNLGEWVLGYKPGVLKFLSPEITTFYRFTSELNGINNANIHTRGSLKYEFFKDQFFRIVPTLEVGYQAANNNIDKRNGFSDVTARLQFFFGNLFVGLNGIHRPNLYLYDNDRAFPKTGAYGDVNAKDGMTVDPSKTASIVDRLALDEIAKLPGRGVAEYITRNYQQQHIEKNIFIVNIGYSLKF